jgi:hypothetical protein
VEIERSGENHSLVQSSMHWLLQSSMHRLRLSSNTARSSSFSVKLASRTRWADVLRLVAPLHAAPQPRGESARKRKLEESNAVMAAEQLRMHAIGDRVMQASAIW